MVAAPIYDIPVKTMSGEGSLRPWSGQVMLIVNVASECGYTPQYKGLESLYQQYKDRGFTVLGFPCNQFGRQEPGTEAEIKSNCEMKFGVSFPLFGKVEVNGAHAAPLFQHLKKEKPGILGTEAIKWNFTKFLVGRKGEVLARFAPSTAPDELTGDIEQALSATLS